MSFEEPIHRASPELPPQRTLRGWELSRRQFVVLVGTSTASIAVAWGYGVTTNDSPPANSPFWGVRIVRAGRGARLMADGSPAFHAALGPDVFNGRASRAAAGRAISSTLAVASVASMTSHSDRHSGGSHPATPYPQPGNFTWGDVVVLEAEVRNTSAAPSLFSPGQLRLKLANGPTITPQDASRGPAPIAAGAVEMLWISYLAPSNAADFSVEFTDPRGETQQALRLPGLVTAKA